MRMYYIDKIQTNKSIVVVIFPKVISLPSFLSSNIVGKMANMETKLEKISCINS